MENQHLSTVWLEKPVQKQEINQELQKENSGSKNHYQGILADRYQVDENEDKVKILEQIALNRNCKMKGNELDYEKASKIVLEEFRNGKLGKISLETPEEGTKEA